MIAIVDYGIDKNELLSELFTGLKIEFKFTDKEPEILRADKVILPHTHSISSALKQLHLLNLFTMLRVCKKPMLGISSGMHLMSTFVKEENLSCLGIFHGTTENFLNKSFKNQRANINEVIFIKESRLFDNLKIEERFFFDNQFYLPVDKNTTAVSGQVPIISAAIEKNIFFGLQFLPEKSGEAGIQIIKNFAQL